MNKANQYQKNIRPRQVFLYRNVFYSRVSTAVVLCLCTSFLLQPIERVYANESTVNNAVQPEILNLAIDAGLLNNKSPAREAQSTESVSDPVMDDQGVLATEDSVASETVSGDTLAATTTDTSNGTTTVFTDEEIRELIDAEGGALPIVDITGSTSTATTTENPIAISTVQSDAVMQFNRNDCVTVEDGSFYCQTLKEEAEQGTDGMYALQDKDGDLEIFLQKNGELTQLTFNTVDDAAPYFDSKSNSIVWHRLVDERYQIIAYDLDQASEVQLTADSVNNMEPSRFGDYTVWQRWNGDNWDIVLYDGRETKFITDSLLHDIGPNVKGDLVMWNRLTKTNSQTIELFDLNTLEYTTITDTEGGALSNPRMVLVYETEFTNGDVVTKGYDVETGEITPLANNPAQLPDELPEPDATGETRALLQPKNPVKEDSETGETIFPPQDSSGTTPATTTASTTRTEQVEDLHISGINPAVAGSTILATTSQSVHPLTLDLTPPVALDPSTPVDLIIPPYTASTTNDI